MSCIIKVIFKNQSKTCIDLKYFFYLPRQTVQPFVKYFRTEINKWYRFGNNCCTLQNTFWIILMYIKDLF